MPLPTHQHTYINTRLFLSAEPPPSLERPLPISLLQACIKLTNEPPEGLKVHASCLLYINLPHCARPMCGVRTRATRRSYLSRVPNRGCLRPSRLHWPTFTRA